MLSDTPGRRSAQPAPRDWPKPVTSSAAHPPSDEASASRFFVQVYWSGAVKKKSPIRARPSRLLPAAPQANAKCSDRRIDPVWLRSVLLNVVSIFSLFIIVTALSASPRSFAAEQPSDVPAWLSVYVDEGEGQIAQVVLQRAQALYLHKVSEGAIKNSCYFAMDATRPSDLSDGKLGRWFYVICEADWSFRAISAGHGGRSRSERHRGFRKRKTVREELQQCDGFQTGGAYVTGETKASFKGYYRVSAKQDAVLIRSFVQFDGEGQTANAKQRQIGGHGAVLLRGVCLRKDPDSPYANHDGYVPFGKLADYAGGRSDGCTSWSQSDARQIIAIVKDDPRTLYIYPDAADVDAVAQAVKTDRSLSRAGCIGTLPA
jgi:hypothetical protein